MADEPYALTLAPAPPPSQADYDAIHDAVTESERGRWFLLQYASRNRNADTRLLLAAIDRLEALIRGGQGSPPDALRADLVGMARAIADTKAGIAAIRPLAAAGYDGSVVALSVATASIRDAAKQLADISRLMREGTRDETLCANLDANAAEIANACALLDRAAEGAQAVSDLMRALEGQIDALIARLGTDENAPGQAQVAPPAPVAPRLEASKPPQPEAVSTMDETPTPAAEVAAGAPVAVVEQVAVSAGEAAAISDAAASEAVMAAGATATLEPAPAEPAPAEPQPAAPPPDPLAPIVALSDEEKIALFS